MVIDNTGNPPLESEREELRHWAHTIHQIDDSLDLSLIEGRARQLMFQALNTQTLTSFVGTGVSAAYGRMGWSEWQDVQLGVTGDLSRAFLSLAEDADKRLALRIDEFAQLIQSESHETEAGYGAQKIWRWLAHRRQVLTRARRQISDLHRSFERAKTDGEFPGGERFPILFEIAQKLHDQVLDQRRFFLPDIEQSDDEITCFWGTAIDPMGSAPCEALAHYYDRGGFSDGNDFKKAFCHYAALARRPEGQMSFETIAKVLLVDECAHAEHILLRAIDGRVSEEERSGLRDMLNVITQDNLKRDVSGIRQNPDRFRVLQFFRLKEMIDFFDQKDLPEGWKPLFESVRQMLEEHREEHGKSRVFLTPPARFLVGVIAELFEDPRVPLGALVKGEHWDKPSDISRSDFTSRQAIISNHMDPLDFAIRKLGISRFLTTNYDFEIERFYQDLGYRRIEHVPPEGGDDGEGWRERFDRHDYRVDGLGGALRDLSFGAETASDLVTFSVGHDDPDAAVFHLHGRATKEDPLVITERDYMDRYLRNDPNRETVDESITMAFSSTPLLFLGLGMNESDVLRPLRQFISDKDRSMGYTAVVMMPAFRSIDDRSKTASSLFLRYGVHTIFYGGGVVAVGSDKKPIDWLHRIFQLIAGLDAHLEDRQKELKKEGKLPATVPETLLDHLKDKVGTLDSDLQPESADEICALSILYGVDSLTPEVIGSSDATLRSCVFTSIRPGRNEAQQAARRGSTPPGIDGGEYTDFYLKILTHLLRMSFADPAVETDDGAQEYERDLKARRTALEGLKGALLTGALCAALAGIESDWRDWLKYWQQRPPLRDPKLEELLITDQSEGGAGDPVPRDEVHLPRIFIRHRVQNAITDLTTDDTGCENLIVPSGNSYDLKDDYPTLNIRSFDTFIAAVQTQSLKSLNVAIGLKRGEKYGSNDIKPAPGRRFYTVASRAGMGKGTFFSAFSTALGLRLYIRAAHPTVRAGHLGLPGGEKNFEPEHPDAAFVGAIFLNFSFSTEIGSVYDMLAEALLELTSWVKASGIIQRGVACSHTQSLQPEELDRAHSALKERDHAGLAAHLAHKTMDSDLGQICHRIAEDFRDSFKKRQRNLSRTSYLRNLLTTFREASVSVCDNARVGSLSLEPRILICMSACELMFAPCGRAKNLEIAAALRFLSSYEAADLPIDLVMIGSDQALGAPWTRNARALDPSLSPGRQLSLQHRVIKRQKVSDRGSDAIDKRIERSNIAIDLPRHTASDGAEPPSDPLPSNMANFVYFSRLMDPVQLMIDNFLPLACALFGRWAHSASELKEVANAAQPKAGFFAAAQEQYRSEMQDAWAQRNHRVPSADGDLAGKRRARDSKISDQFDEVRLAFARAAELDEELSFAKVLSARYKHKAASKDAEDWLNIRTVLSGNRYCLTLLLAAAQEIVLNENDWRRGAELAESFVFKTVDKVRAMSEADSETTVVQAVMDTYRLYHQIGSPWRDVELHEHILRCISVINSPVSADVLVRLPSIRSYFNSMGEVVSNPLSRRRTVAAALIYLGDRGLVFRIAPHYNLRDSQAAGPISPPEAAEPGERALPEPLPEGADPSAETSPEPPLGDEEKSQDALPKWPPEEEHRYSLHRLMQRYCVSNLGSRAFEPNKTNGFAPSRYASLPSDVPRLNHEAYRFLRGMLIALSQYPDLQRHSPDEAHGLFAATDANTRVQALRASISMIRSVFSIAVVSRFEDYKAYPGEQTAHKRGYFEFYKIRLLWILRKAWRLKNESGVKIATLYRDEVVWLYNEIGITCIVQGALGEAVSYLRRALQLNREIEGPEDTGPTSSIIALNLAIAQLERGRIDKAIERLEGLAQKEHTVSAEVYHMSRGYLGLAHHLSGRRSKASELLSASVDYFKKRGDLRATAIFRSHYGRLAPGRDLSAASKLLHDARENAEAGGHEDIRHRILISQVRVSRLKGEATAHHMTTLSNVEAYARKMEIPALACDAAHERALILIEAGDTSSAGMALVRAMALARRNQMNLRLNSMMTSYAQVLWLRNQALAAQRLIYASLEMAKGSKYALEVDRIQAVLRSWESER